MKICIGTAQLGMKYGIANKSPKMKFDDFSKILNLSLKNNIRFIDTAINYGNSEELIGKAIIKNKYRKAIYVITKVDKLRFIPKKKISEYIENYVNSSIKKLKVKKLYAVLIHDTKDLDSSKNICIYKSLIKIKKKGLVKKIGLSSYNIKDLKKYLSKFKFDIVQFPFNVFDQRILQKDIQKFLRNKKVEIHIRSIFLQGLLLLPRKMIPKKFFLKNNALDKWFKIINNTGMSPLDLSLNFILKYNFYKKIVIGFDDYLQFKEITKKLLNLKKKKLNINFQNLSVNNKIINPSKW